MDDTAQVIAVGLVIGVLTPLIGGFLKRKRKAKIKYVVICPHCSAENGLDKLRNLICHSCGGSIAFFKRFDSDELIADLPRIKCPACKEENFKMMRDCVKCKTSLHPPA